jgi:DNA polymerase-1
VKGGGTMSLDFGGAGPPAPPAATADRVLTLIDASGYIFRAFHALPGLTTSKGVPTNAVLGFARMLLKTLRELSPTHVALCFDKDSRKGRLALDPNYKATRAETPEALVGQFELIRKVAGALNVPILEVPGWEADDVIGTLALQARDQGFKVLVISSDKDFVQLIDDRVELYDPVQDRRISAAEAIEKFGVKPAQMRDYLSLVGDASDNVPKVPGVGPKTAVELLAQFGDVETLLSRLAEVKKPKVREALAAHVDQIRLAMQLVSFKVDLDLPTHIEDLVRRPIHGPEARALFTELEFFRLIPEMPAVQATEISQPTQVAVERAALEAIAQAAADAKSLALVAAFDGLPYLAPLVGLALGVPDGRTWYVPLAHALGPNAERGEFKAVLGAVLSDVQVKKNGHELKAVQHLTARLGVELRGVEGDVALLSYLLNPSRKEFALADLARERLGVELPGAPGQARGKHKTALAEAQVSAAAACFGAWADAARRLAPLLWEEAEKVGLAHVARELELPLLPILGRMEQAGIRVDLGALEQISKKVDLACEERLKTIYALAGHELNVGSPAQLAQVLYVELGLPVLKRGKTGPSTDQEVLEKLSAQHALPGAIIEYRNVAKLKSTYLDTLPALVAPDGRVHTTFNQVAAATGRLSSTDPNMQNIPVRTELGREIRRAFVAEPGWQLVSADYSQIELRILAHISGDPGLIQAFADNADVHTRTAAEVFGVPAGEVTSEQRRAAKMVNYGIAYGLSAHGLSARLAIPVEEAAGIIERYFKRYAGIHQYLEETVAKAKKAGFVETLFGRRRYMPELGSPIRAVVAAGERAAINLPIQGTAADLAKLAMLKADRALTEQRLSARMLLQVHDELVFEAPDGEVVQVRALAKEAMSSVAQLKVPLEVQVGAGHSWADAH